MNDKMIKLVDDKGTEPFTQRQWNRVQSGSMGKKFKGASGTCDLHLKG